MVLILTLKTKHLIIYVRLDIIYSNVRIKKSELPIIIGEKKMKKNKKLKKHELERVKDEYFRKAEHGYFYSF